MKKLTSKSFKFIPAALCLGLVLLANNAKAASSYWDIDGANPGAGGITPDGSWEGAFWSTDSTGSSATTIWTDGDFPIFAADGATGSYTVTADAPHTIAGMQMQTSAGTVTVNGTGILSIAPGVQGFFSSGTLQINSMLGGTGGYEGQSGTVQLYGNNTFSGGSLLNGNLTYFNNNNSFGSGTITPVFVAVTPPGYSAVLSSGGALITLPNNFVISTANAGVNFASGASTPVTCTGTWDLQQTLYLRNNGDSTAPLTLSGVLSDVGGLTVSANYSGTILLSGANTYGGGTSLIMANTGVKLQLGNASALGTGATTIASGCALDLNGNSITAALTVNGSGIPVNTGALINSSATPASISASSTVTMSSVGQNYIGGTGDMTVNCGITSVGNQNFVKTGTGTLTFNAANSFGSGQCYLGGNSVAGTLAIGNASALGTGVFNINAAPATVRSADTTSYTIGNALTIGASGTLPGPHIIIGAPGTGNLTFTGNANTGGTADKTIQANGITVTFSGVISGNGAKVLGWAGINGGRIVLSGANTFQKTNVLYSGTVQVAHSDTGTVGPLGAKNTAGYLAFGGGTLQYSSANQFDYSARYCNDTTPANIANRASQPYNIDVNGQSVINATALTSSGGTLTLSDTASGGTLTLTKANTYAGGTTINAGTLDVSSTGSIAGNVTINGGVLQLDNTTALASGATLTLPASPSANQVNLNLSGGTQNIAALYFGTTQMAAGTWGASGAQHNNPAFTGNGLLNVASGPQPSISITSITPNPVCSGSTVSLTATVSGGNPNSAPSGTVQFYNSYPTTLGTPQPLLSGTATLTGVSLPAGTYANITAQYSGDNYNNPATSLAASPALVVNPGAATSAISGSTSVAINQLGNTYSVTLTSGSTYAWSVPSGAAITAGGTGPNNYQITVNFGSTDGNVTVTETTSLGCVGAPVSQAVTVGPNHAPVAPPNKTLNTVKNTAATFDNVKLLAGATDLDSDTLTVTAASSPMAHGATVLEADDVKYTPATDYTGPDRYTYTISDGNGGTAIGTVDVTVSSDSGLSPNVVGDPTFDSGTGTFSVTFAGIPDYVYTVEYAVGSAAPPWTKLQNVTAGPLGLFTVTDGPGLSGSRYYRTVYPSY